jgi:mycofactocin precursor
MEMKEKNVKEGMDPKKETDSTEQQAIAPSILEEITIEELAVDGICGIY